MHFSEISNLMISGLDKLAGGTLDAQGRNLRMYENDSMATSKTPEAPKKLPYASSDVINQNKWDHGASGVPRFPVGKVPDSAKQYAHIETDPMQDKMTLIDK